MDIAISRTKLNVFYSRFAEREKFMNEKDFKTWREIQKKSLLNNHDFNNLCKDWHQVSVDQKYSYQFDWLGVPIIQYPTDLIAFQDVVFRTKPDLIIECGVARGGSLIFWASMQSICGVNPRVIGIDIDIMPHTLEAIRNSIFSDSIELIISNSTDEKILVKIGSEKLEGLKVMIVLDSNHTFGHVLKELEIFSKLVTKGNYLLVLDTSIELLNPENGKDWHPGNSPMNAVFKFLEKNHGFSIDSRYDSYGVSVAKNGFLIKD